MDKDTLYEVIKKLVGNIAPIGETNEDDKRFENLKVLTDLLDQLLFDIDHVARQKNRQEHSIQRAGKYASNFFDRLGIKE